MRNRNAGKIVITIVILLIVALVLSACILISMKVENHEIQLEGNQKYTKEEMMRYIFQSDMDRNPLVIWYKSKFKAPVEIPFVAHYEIQMHSFNRVTIMVYEKKIVGYVKYKGVNMYFDKDGTIVESSMEILEGIPEVTGLTFNYIVLDEPLPVGNENVFRMILDVTQGLNKHAVPAQKLYISDEKETTVYIDEVAVELGENKDTNEKIQTLADMLPNLQGLSGTLDMKQFDESGKGYTFKKKTKKLLIIFQNEYII